MSLVQHQGVDHINGGNSRERLNCDFAQWSESEVRRDRLANLERD